jgi:hypothetical protein
MVPKITTPHSIRRALNYNEQKVKDGQAELIHAGNFLQRPEEMNFYHKLERFQKLMDLNTRSRTKTVHISLNFHPSENEKLTKELLREIANEYMRRIGFENQPYLVYQHYDAGHPHVHIVSTTIQEDGSRINTHNLGRNQSETARKELEIEYGLIQADKGMTHDLSRELVQKEAFGQKIKYGKSETRRSIANVLDAVVNQYKYTSLPELNAVLREYNVAADRGQEDGRIFKNRGLTYRILDENGQKVGVPVKASSIYSKPTLAFLESKFSVNALRREQDLPRMKAALDWILLKSPGSLEEYKTALVRESISVAIRRGDQGRVYGLTYIDHQTKAVFNGSDIGKAYSANQIIQRFNNEATQELIKDRNRKKGLRPEAMISEKPKGQKQIKSSNKERVTGVSIGLPRGSSSAIEILLNPETNLEKIPFELKRQKRRKRNNQQSREL